jgi:hypothetical protein
LATINQAFKGIAGGNSFGGLTDYLQRNTKITQTAKPEFRLHSPNGSTLHLNSNPNLSSDEIENLATLVFVDIKDDVRNSSSSLKATYRARYYQKNKK